MEQAQEKTYVQKIDALLSNYVDGRNVFTNYKKSASWSDSNLRLRPGAEERGAPTNVLALAETVIGIIARDKYGLDHYPNRIEVIDSKQMLSAYSSVGMPVSYDHWSFGKELIRNERAYQAGQQGLAYEIVINTDPAIAYCMEENSMTMQLLVIAHASFGHNSFFKNNHLFRQFTSAKNILGDLRQLKGLVSDCEDAYGVDAVETILDAAHALESFGVYRRARPRVLTEAEAQERRYRIEESIRQNQDPVLKTFQNRAARKQFNASAGHMDLQEDENILHVVASLAPHMPPKQRQLLEGIADKAQYFYPQRQTQLMNEGWASFWHYTLMHDLADLGLVSGGMMVEFTESHTNVVFQPEFDKPYYSGINPYALGFAMYRDIQRICQNPTEEDRRWFPKFAGNPDWLSVVKEAQANHKDESFVSQYLSPKLMREFRLFTIEDNASDSFYRVAAIHNDDGYRTLRQHLSRQYDLSEIEPQIEAVSYHTRHDRTLVLRHTIKEDRPLHQEDAELILQYTNMLWGHPVVLQSVTPEGKVVNTLGCPRISSRIDKGSGTHKTVPRLATPVI